MITGLIAGLLWGGGAAAAPGEAGGYGRFSWGSTIEEVTTIEKGARDHPEAEPVARESAALERLEAASKAKAEAAGREAMKAWKAAARPTPRLAARRYWVDLAGLPGRVELRFVDGALYAAVVRVLYRAKDKPAAGEILDALVAKYGAPLDPPVGQAPPAERPRLDWALPGGGALRVMRRRVEGPRGRGMLRLHYRGPGSAAVEEHLDALAARVAALDAVDTAKDGEKRPTRTPKPRTGAALMDHL